MAKLTYGEEELRQTRARLTVKDEEDAKFMMKVLGGEVGDIRPDTEESKRRSDKKQPYEKQAPLRRVETVADEEAETSAGVQLALFPVEKLTYRERVKMDAQESESEFKIKTWFQVFRSRFSFFKPPPDVINKVFVTTKMDEYFLPLKRLVNMVRLAFPRNNADRNKKLKQDFPFAFSILDLIRYWDVERISSSLSNLQSRPRSVVVSDFRGIIRAFYRPLFILKLLDSEIHLVQAVEDLKTMLHSMPQSDTGTRIDQKTQNEIVTLYNEVNEDTRYRLYPLLMKFVSPTYLPYGVFFVECEERIQEFLGVTPEEIILPAKPVKAYQVDTAVKNNAEDEFDDDALFSLPAGDKKEEVSGLSQNKPKAVQRGLDVLEQLFPEAGWDRLDMFPDIYHYFAKSFSLKRNEDIIDPANPMLQALILMRILEELFYGFRSISFNEVGFDLMEFLDIIDGWHKLIENGFERIYIPRLAEFAKLFYNPLEAKQKIYAMKVREELNWTARLFLFPMMKNDMFSQGLISKKDISPAFPKIRTLRQDFSIIAGEIEKTIQERNTFIHAHCSVINNPWEKYVFQVENPLSKRLDALLSKDHRTNVSLIYYTMSVLSVLDYFLISSDSWAYKTNSAKLFRSSDADGLVPEPPPERNIDADAIFKRHIERLKAQGAAKKEADEGRQH
jgi:hypothetical protein